MFKDNYPAWVVPNIGYVGSGPSGISTYPGIGLNKEYDNSIWLVDFAKGLTSFKLKSKGAGFIIKDFHYSVKTGFSISDFEFGFDGKIYVAYWGDKWGINAGSGRLDSYFIPEIVKQKEVQEVKKLFSNGFKKLSSKKLLSLLKHKDMRVRLQSQYELATRKDSVNLFIKNIYNVNNQEMVILHSLWGLQQIITEKKISIKLDFEKLLAHKNSQILAKIAQFLGDIKYHSAYDKLINLLKNSSSRVKFFAAQSLGKIGNREAIIPLFKSIESEDFFEDSFLRHSIIFALSKLSHSKDLKQYANSSNYLHRLTSILVLRKKN